MTLSRIKKITQYVEDKLFCAYFQNPRGTGGFKLPLSVSKSHSLRLSWGPIQAVLLPVFPRTGLVSSMTLSRIKRLVKMWKISCFEHTPKTLKELYL